MKKINKNKNSSARSYFLHFLLIILILSIETVPITENQNEAKGDTTIQNNTKITTANNYTTPINTNKIQIQTTKPNGHSTIQNNTKITTDNDEMTTSTYRIDVVISSKSTTLLNLTDIEKIIMILLFNHSMSVCFID